MNTGEAQKKIRQMAAGFRAFEEADAVLAKLAGVEGEVQALREKSSELAANIADQERVLQDVKAGLKRKQDELNNLSRAYDEKRGALTEDLQDLRRKTLADIDKEAGKAKNSFERAQAEYNSQMEQYNSNLSDLARKVEEMEGRLADLKARVGSI